MNQDIFSKTVTHLLRQGPTMLNGEGKRGATPISKAAKKLVLAIGNRRTPFRPHESSIEAPSVALRGREEYR